MSRTSDRTYLKNRKRIRHLDTCWLCGQWIDDTLKSPHPMSWSSDHVHPVGRGGNNRGELKPAHRICNMRRNTIERQRQHNRHGRQW